MRWLFWSSLKTLQLIRPSGDSPAPVAGSYTIGRCIEQKSRHIQTFADFFQDLHNFRVATLKVDKMVVFHSLQTEKFIASAT
jgi:hypothetical protein